MANPYFSLSERDRREAIAVAVAALGRSGSVLEKDLMVVWALEALYSSPFANHLSFKGGTSLSKVYGVINRFSEDVDITYDIRAILGDKLEIPENGLPPSSSQAKKWTKIVREELPKWIDGEIVPWMKKRSEESGIQLGMRLEANERLFLDYKPLHEDSAGYVKPSVMLEFGARSTGEPTQNADVVCDMAAILPDIVFPTPTVNALMIGRTFWEKATAVHVYSAQRKLKGDGFSRHWYDLHCIANSDYYEESVSDLDLAAKVADHKSWFFSEKDQDGNVIDYRAAVDRGISLVPNGDALDSLAADYEKMKASRMLAGDPPLFQQVLDTCQQIQDRINAAPAPGVT